MSKVPVRCPVCLKPLLPSALVITDNSQAPYILCPWGNCQTKIYLPFEHDEGSNPELKQHVKNVQPRDPLTGRWIKAEDVEDYNDTDCGC